MLFRCRASALECCVRIPENVGAPAGSSGVIRVGLFDWCQVPLMRSGLRRQSRSVCLRRQSWSLTGRVLCCYWLDTLALVCACERCCQCGLTRRNHESMPRLVPADRSDGCASDEPGIVRDTFKRIHHHPHADSVRDTIDHGCQCGRGIAAQAPTRDADGRRCLAQRGDRCRSSIWVGGSPHRACVPPSSCRQCDATTTRAVPQQADDYAAIARARASSHKCVMAVQARTASTPSGAGSRAPPVALSRIREVGERA